MLVGVQASSSVELTDGVVHGLVDSWLHPPPLIRNVPDLCYLPCGVVAEAKLHELALLVQLVDSLQSLLERHRPVWCVEVEDIDGVCAQLFQGGAEVLLQRLRLVNSGFV